VSDTSTDGFLAGRLMLEQPVDGYRAGLDAMLLAAAVADQDYASLLDVGCGVGAVMLAAALRRPDARHAGLERDPGAVALCHRNIAFNGLQSSAEVIEGDHLARGGPDGFDLVVSNPPFFDDASAIRDPAPARRAAWIADAPLEDWIRAMLRRAAPKGVIALIHRADRIADVLAALKGRAGGVTIMPVHPRMGAPATRVLVSARKGTRAPIRIKPGLVVHPDPASGRFTPETEAVLAGETLSKAVAGTPAQWPASSVAGGGAAA